jgi:acetoacetate decarboxylase
VALGTMVYKQRPMDHAKTVEGMKKRNVNLKFVPDVEGKPKVAQLVGYHLENIDLKFAFTGEARLHLVPHANCRLADLPVRKIHYGQHLCTDLTQPYGEVLYDYLVETK